MDESQDKPTTDNSSVETEFSTNTTPEPTGQFAPTNTPPPQISNPIPQPSLPPAKQSFFSKFSRKQLLIIAGVVLVIVIATVAWLMTRSKPATNAGTSATANTKKASSQKGAVGLVQGTVEYYSGNSWKAATTATELQAGDELKTGANSRAVVTLDDGSAIRLDANTQVRFSTLTLTDVTLDNRSGAVYTRVTTSDQRKFVVNSNEQSYRAMGTAYRTFNLTDKQGVEVFQSTVQTKDKSSVTEGQGFFTKNTDTAKVNKVSQLDLTQLQNDEFLLWNKSEDEKDKEFSVKLGVLKDIKKPAATPAPATTQPTTANNTTAIIKISGSATADGIKVSWSASGVNTSDGFKIAYSTTSATPKYGTDSSQYVTSGSSYTLPLTDGKTYYIRVCAYRPNAKTCENYSSAIKVTAPKKESSSEVPTSGSMSLNLSGTTLSWTFTGTAPYGFKVVHNQTGNPTYPENEYLYLSSATDTSADLSSLNLKTGVNYIRVCKYTAGKKTEPCIDYSNQITYTKP